MDEGNIMKQQAAPRERLAHQRTFGEEWTIYPTEAGAYACGSPDGRELHDGQAVEMRLGGRWIPGVLQQYAYQSPQFVALDDQSVCGLCPGMHIRLVEPRSASSHTQQGA